MNSSYSHQQGAVLIVSLVLLVIMTLLGLSSMNNTVMEERMAGNLRNSNLAFQSSEAALRAGESAVGALSGSRPVATVSAVNNNIFTLDGPDPDTSNYENWWQERDASWWNSNGVAYGNSLKYQSAANLASPRYVLEELQVIPDSLNVGEQSDYQNARVFYQVTSRGTGSANRAVSLLRSTYARRF